MIYLSGVACPEAIQLGIEFPGRVGLMMTPYSAYAPARATEYDLHALDNGAYSHPIEPGDKAEAKWLRWLDRQERAGCRFALVPDAAFHEGMPVPDPAPRTLAHFERYHDRVRAAGFPVAFALQNGQESLPVPWELIDAVFIGGDTAWKLSHHALALVWEAKDRGLWVHMGRANSNRRLQRAAEMRVDSADGNFMRWPKANMDRLRGFLEGTAGHRQLAMA